MFRFREVLMCAASLHRHFLDFVPAYSLGLASLAISLQACSSSDEPSGSSSPVPRGPPLDRRPVDARSRAAGTPAK